MGDKRTWIENLIGGFTESSADNTLRNAAGDPAWDAPLVGFSGGADPLYEFFKKDIGEFYWTPAEIFRATFPGNDARAEDLTVISWVLPQTGKTRQDNLGDLFPSESWARSRVYGEAFNGKLAQHLAEVLTSAGFPALAPSSSPHWGWRDSENYGMASNWSERHTAYVSGLGTFGLCDGLITARGKAMRCGSVVAKIRLEPTKRPYAGRSQYCSFLNESGCGKCIERCPVGAITMVGHNKEKCRKFLKIVSDRSLREFGFESYGCGLCQTGVPCESGIPAAENS
ncbi:MAG TPA: 4Fe-4S binding protein [Syntrophales bacterium]|nr:4Fe-4S binding protein [Syntrophales bacterium]